MQDNDDKLKSLFNDKHREDDFSFDQQNWEKLSSVLKEERKNEKRVVIYLSTLALILGLTGIYFLNLSDKPDNQLSVERKNSNPILTGKSLESSLKETNSVQKESNSVKHFPQKTSADTKEKISQITTEKTSTSKTIALKEVANAAKEPVSIINDQEKTQTKASKNEEKESSHENTGNDDTKTNSTYNDTKPVTEAEPVKVPTIQEPITEEKKAADQPVTKEKPDTGLVVNKFPIAAGNIGKTEAQVEPTPTAVIENESKTVNPAEPVLIAKPDSLSSPVALKADSIPVKIIPTNVLSLEAGATYLFGWKNNNTTEANGFNPVLGLSYYTVIAPKIGLSVGVQFTTVKNLTATSHTSATTRIKFGEESDVTVISAKEMYYLMAPIKLTYNINNNNIIGLGYNVAYLMDVKSDVKTYTRHLGYQSDPVVSSSLGYKTGFDMFDGQLALCYRRRIYNELFINGEVFYGIKDIKNNLTYGSSEFERNYGFKLTLSCGLLKK